MQIKGNGRHFETVKCITFKLMLNNGTFNINLFTNCQFKSLKKRSVTTESAAAESMVLAVSTNSMSILIF